MDPRILQMIMALISRNSQAQPFGGGSGQSPQWGQQGPYGAPSNPGMPQGGQMGQSPRMGQLPQRQYGSAGYGQPSNIPTGQPPMGQNPRLAMNPPQQMVDYRNGTMTQPRQQDIGGGAPGNPFRVR